jgi:carbonic anhydrase/acetyltransferase-like protein (isoleucine patch superfamily)
MIRPYQGKNPKLGPDVFVADTAMVIGDVEIGARSTIWFGAVIRGDVYYIRIGEDTSIQDNSVIHVTHGQNATVIGNRVTVGHSVTLHGCTVRDRCIIGMGSTVLDLADVGERCILGAGSLVSPGTKIPPGHLALGNPARVKRPLTEKELDWIESSADHYVELAKTYR